MRISLALAICILGLIQTGCGLGFGRVRAFRAYRFLSQNYDPVINNTSQTTRHLVPGSESYQVVDPDNPSSTYILTQDQDRSWVFIEVSRSADTTPSSNNTGSATTTNPHAFSPGPKEERAK